MQLETDTDVKGTESDAFDMGALKPLGHFVYPARSLALVSEGFGCQGFFDAEQEALPIMRIKARAALQGKSKLDFRLYRWDRNQLAWFVAVRTLELGGGGVHA